MLASPVSPMQESQKGPRLHKILLFRQSKTHIRAQASPRALLSFPPFPSPHPAHTSIEPPETTPKAAEFPEICMTKGKKPLGVQEQEEGPIDTAEEKRKHQERGHRDKPLRSA